MTTIQITNQAINYLSESLHIDKDEAEEHLQWAFSFCQISGSEESRLIDLLKSPVNVRVIFSSHHGSSRMLAWSGLSKNWEVYSQLDIDLPRYYYKGPDLSAALSALKGDQNA